MPYNFNSGLHQFIFSDIPMAAASNLLLKLDICFKLCSPLASKGIVFVLGTWAIIHTLTRRLRVASRMIDHGYYVLIPVISSGEDFWKLFHGVSCRDC